MLLFTTSLGNPQVITELGGRTTAGQRSSRKQLQYMYIFIYLFISTGAVFILDISYQAGLGRGNNRKTSYSYALRFRRIAVAIYGAPDTWVAEPKPSKSIVVKVGFRREN